MKLFRALNNLKLHYEIPGHFQDTLYLANASLANVVGYFAHRAYERLFPELVGNFQESRLSSTEDGAIASVRDSIKRMEFCDYFVDMHIPVERKHGGCDMVRAMRVYHGLSMNHGFALGGLRLCPELQRHNEQGYAIHSTYTNACYELEIGGAHGGLKLNSLVYEPEELKAVLETFALKLSEFRGVVDIIEPDTYIGSTEMLHIDNICGDNVLVMGKPFANGGLPNYETAASKTVLSLLKHFMSNEDVMKRVNFDDTLANKTFIVHGLGRSGVDIATELCKKGAVCVGIRDDNCILYDEGGIPFKALLKHFKKFGTMLNFSPKAIEGDVNRIFTEKCDILLLAASERILNCSIADKIQAKIIIEACNGPITPGADRILLAKSKLIIPSILAGGGHSYMSFLEYLHNAGVLTPSDNPDENEIKTTISRKFDTKIQNLISEITEIEGDMKLSLDFRTAAYAKAIRWMFKKLNEDNEEAHQVVDEKKDRRVAMQYK